LKKTNLRTKTRKVKSGMIVFFLIGMMFFFLIPTTNYQTKSVVTKESMTATIVSSDLNIEKIWSSTWGGEKYDKGNSIWSDGTYLYALGHTGSFGAGSDDFALVKWDTDGNIIWNHTWGGLFDDGGYSIWGNGTYLYTLGYTQTLTSSYDFALVKWDTDGNIIWNHTWGGPSGDSGRSIWSDGTYLYTLGYTSSFGAGNSDFALVKWDTDGNIIWYRIWGGQENEMGYSICGDGTYLYALGYTRSFGAGNSDFALVKWDTDGNIIWYRTWGGIYEDGAYSIWSDGIYLYALGYTRSFGVINPDFALVKWNTDGNIIWYRTWGGIAWDKGNSIWSDGTYLYTLGYTASFGVGDYDFALIKWDTDGNIIWNHTWGGPSGDSGRSIWSDGTYLYTLGYTSSFGAGNSDFALVKWDIDTIAPILTSPSDFSYEQSTTGHNITWTATDTNPDTYIVYKDDVEIASGTWTSGVPITVNVDGLNIGSYNYTIIVVDTSSNSARDTVIVTVVDSDVPTDTTTETTTTGDTTTPTVDSHIPEPDDNVVTYLLIASLIAIVLVITIVVLKRKSKL